MREITAAQIKEATGSKLVQGSAHTVISNVSTDSRKISPDCLFVPLVGEQFDGHTFIPQAIKAGCAAVLSERTDYMAENTDAAVILVEDTLLALGAVAKFYREMCGIYTVGITGSVGKTTTKEMVAAVMSSAYSTKKTPENYNNEIGLPQTILQVEKEQALVLEMGMRGRGQIEYLSNIAAPDIGIITNIGTSHIELLGSQHEIFSAKMEICAGLRSGGTLLLNGDDACLSNREQVRRILSGYGKNITVQYYGTNESCDYRASDIREDDGKIHFTFSSPSGSFPVLLNVPGRHMLLNSLAAAGAGCCAQIAPEKIAQALDQYGTGDVLRQVIDRLDSITLMDDTYNANPESMKAALSVLSGLSGAKRRVAVLGDMLELGSFSAAAHEEIGKWAATCGVSLLLAVGPLANGYRKGFGDAGRSVAAADSLAAADILPELLQPDDAVLVKGSHAMQMERVVEKLRKGGICPPGQQG